MHLQSLGHVSAGRRRNTGFTSSHPLPYVERARQLPLSSPRALGKGKVGRKRRRLKKKASKCEFGRTEFGFLGHRVSATGVAVDPRKVAVVHDWPQPSSNAEVRRFVGLCNYYRRFVEGYAELAAPLTRLCGPHSPWQWGAAEQASFEALKRCLTSAPVLRNFDPRRRAVLTTDASEVAIAAVLACLLSPVVDFFERKKIPRARAILLVFIVDVVLWPVVLVGVFRCVVFRVLFAFFVFIVRRAAKHPLPLPTETLSESSPA